MQTQAELGWRSYFLGHMTGSAVKKAPMRLFYRWRRTNVVGDILWSNRSNRFSKLAMFEGNQS